MAGTSKSRVRRTKGRHRQQNRTNQTCPPWVGAGAVAIGLGAAMATGQGIAVADPDESSASSAASDAEAESPASTGQAPSDSSPAAAPSNGSPTGTQTQPDGPTSTVSAQTNASSDHTDDPDDATDEAADIPTAGDALTTTESEDSAEASGHSDSPPTKAADPPRPTMSAARGGSDRPPAEKRAVSAPATASVQNLTDTTRPAQASVAETPAQPAARAFTFAAAPASPVMTAAPAAPVPTASPAASAPATAGSVMSGVLRWLGGPALTGTMPTTPAAPLVSPVEGLFVSLRRTLFNQTPTTAYNPAQNSQSDEGVVTGDLNATDAEGNPLSFTITDAPEHGQVVVHADGTFTYTPQPAFAHSGGTDTFTVRVADDAGLVVALLRVLNPNFHTATATVNVTITAVNQAPTAAPSLNLPANPGTGQVTGAMNGFDADGDAITYAVVDGPDDGTLNFDATTGSFSYTPDADARLAASQLGATTADTTDTFIVTLDDGTEVTSVAVSVPVTQLDNEIVQTIPVGNGPVGIAVNGDRVYVSNFEDDTVTVINTATGAVEATVPVLDEPGQMAVSEDGTRLYVAESSAPLTSTISVIDTSTNTRIGGFTGPGSIGDIAVIGDRLYVTDGTNDNVAVLDRSTGAVLSTIDVGVAQELNALGIAVSSDKTKLYVADTVGETLAVVDLSTPTPTVTNIPLGGEPSAVAVSHDGSRVYVTLPAGPGNGRVLAVDPVTGDIDTIEVGRFPLDLAVTPDDKRVYVPNALDFTVSVIDTTTNTVIDTIPGTPGNPMNNVAVRPNGTHVFVTTGPNTVSVISVIPDGDPTPLGARTLAAPADSNVMLAAAQTTSQTTRGLLGGVSHLLFNNTPTINYNPAENTQDAEGVVTGDLNTFDADGDALKYTVTQAPANGDVAVNPDGTFTYTPDPDFAHIGGADSFKVRVSDDTYFHLAHLGGGHTTSATINVTVTPVNDPPAVGNPPFAVVAVDPDSGVVMGTVNVTDPDQDTLTYALSTPPDPAKGSVVVDPATGNWTYSPTFEARLKATDVTAIPADQQVSFAISASDGQATTPVPVAAPVPPLAIAATIPVGNDPVDMAVSPNGARVYVTNRFSDTVSVIDTTTNTVIATIPVGHLPQSVAVTPDGGRAYVVFLSIDIVSVIDTTTNTVTTNITLPSSSSATAQQVAISPDGTRAYVTHDDRDLTVIDTATNTVVTTIPVGIFPREFAVSPDGSRVYVSDRSDTLQETVSVIDTTTNAVVTTIPVGDLPWDIAISPDGSRVYAAEDDDITVIDTATNTVIATIDVPDSRGVTVSPDGAHLFVTHSNLDTMSVINTATNTAIATIPAGDAPWRVAISPDGTRAYILNHTISDGTVTVINLG